MASFTRTETGGGGWLYTWNLTTADHTGDAVEVPGGPDKTIQFVASTGGSATATIEGSNDGTNYLSLTDPQGNAISPTDDAMELVVENPRYIRPRLSTVGTGAVWVAALMVKGRH